MNKQLDQQQVYGDIPDDRPDLSPDYLRATLPKAVQEKLAEREAGKPGKKKEPADKTAA